MSQNKTVIKGLEPESAPSIENGVGGNFYGRGPQPNGRGTVFPGMGNDSGVVTNATNTSPSQSKRNNPATGKPVVGFLYSISRTPVGEYWPIHIGQNTIGQNPASDIVLSEGTVSSDHAVLVVRKMKNPEKVIASISDARSTNGTMLNGESLGFTAVECKDGDIITIGENYELFLTLIDATALGLKVCEEFIPIQVDNYQEGPIPAGYTRPGTDIPPYGGPTPPPFGGSYTPGGTVGMDGTSSAQKGGTVGIDDYSKGGTQW